jgi:RNA polymerase sigma-70 factor (ECF subfamily)
MDQPERELLARYRAGDVDAMGELVEMFRRPLFGFILRMLEGHGDAEEVFQEVWLRVIKHQRRYTHKNFKSWLFRIAQNLVIDRARKTKPIVDLQGSALNEGENVFETRVKDRGLSAPDRIDAGLLGERILAAVRSLPEEQRAVFLMRTEADLPFKEIARVQGTSINTSLARMQYALAKLREALKSEYRELQGAAP